VALEARGLPTKDMPVEPAQARSHTQVVVGAVLEEPEVTDQALNLGREVLVLPLALRVLA
jgi:hypothetical protein